MTFKELQNKAGALAPLPGCYIMHDATGKIIYIGKAKKLKNRVSSYFRDGARHDAKVAKMVSLVFDFDVIVTDSEFEALVLECSLIKQHKPKYNILLKDDKGYCYIKVTHERYPRITVELQKLDDGARYIGPYISTLGIRAMVTNAQAAFRLPSCHKKFPEQFGRERPCLNAHIGRCMALCEGKITESEYNKTIEDAVTLLTKGSGEILRSLKADMHAASDNLEFERAARLRDSIISIEKAHKGQKVIKGVDDADTDVFAFAADERNICAVVLKFRAGRLADKDERMLYDTTSLDDARDEFVTHYYIDGRDIPLRVLCDAAFESMDSLAELLSRERGRRVSVGVPQRGDNHALEAMAYNNAAERLRREAGRKSHDEAAAGELANLLGLPDVPAYIEAYDVSNYGSEAVAGLVVFKNGTPKRSDYKRFIIKTVSGVDDYAAMTEAITRRVRRFADGKSSAFAHKPDLILLDGGKGHLSVVSAALVGTPFEGVPIFGMVKDDKHRTRGIVGAGGEIEVS
ncbi:MAG: excinuclease ABC subunit UvrC, partial [Oscillospiraceae bacterium]